MVNGASDCICNRRGAVDREHSNEQRELPGVLGVSRIIVCPAETSVSGGTNAAMHLRQGDAIVAANGRQLADQLG
jgi:hypothetical protein